MIRPIMYLVALLVLTVYHGLKAIIPGYLRVPYRPGGVYDQAGRGWARGLIRAAGVKVKTVGLERVPTDRPVVYVSNHQSLFDILALAATVPGTMRFVAKKEFLKIPILGRAMKSAGQIFIDRQNLARAFGAYEEAAQAVREGLNAVVFAEGTRSRTGALQPFKKGPFVFAIASQVPVIPVYCAGTFKVLPKGSIWVHPGPVTLYFGDMIPTEGLTYEDRGALLERTRDVIMKFRVDAGEEER